jgi:hypothetical protein
MHARWLAVLVVAVSSGCASSGTSSGTSARSSRSQDVIGEAEIASRVRDATNALQIIEQLRPQMLRSRGSSSLTPGATSDDALPRVYVDDISYGKCELAVQPELGLDPGDPVHKGRGCDHPVGNRKYRRGNPRDDEEVTRRVT